MIIPLRARQQYHRPIGRLPLRVVETAPARQPSPSLLAPLQGAARRAALADGLRRIANERPAMLPAVAPLLGEAAKGAAREGWELDVADLIVQAFGSPALRQLIARANTVRVMA